MDEQAPHEGKEEETAPPLFEGRESSASLESPGRGRGGPRSAPPGGWNIGLQGLATGPRNGPMGVASPPVLEEGRPPLAPPTLRPHRTFRSNSLFVRQSDPQAQPHPPLTPRGAPATQSEAGPGWPEQRSKFSQLVSLAKRSSEEEQRRGAEATEGGDESLKFAVKQCMDPRCQSCPPEMHVYRNQKMMAEMTKQAAEEEEEEHPGGAAGKDKNPLLIGHQPIPGIGFLDDDSDDDILDPEKGSNRIKVRLCGVPLFSYQRKSAKRAAAGKRRVFRVKLLWRYIRSLWSKDAVYHPNSRYILAWRAVFVFAACGGFVVDPLFYFTLGVLATDQLLCVTLHDDLALGLTIARSIVDACFLFNSYLAFRTAYKVPLKEGMDLWGMRSTKDPSGKKSGEYVFQRKFIFLRYLNNGDFFADVLLTLPIPQVITLVAGPADMENGGLARVGSVFLWLAVVLQAFPRTIRAWSLYLDSNQSSIVKESAWANFVLNLVFYVMASHFVGCIWYFLTMQRVSACLFDACSTQGPTVCSSSFLYCSHGPSTSFAPSTPSVADWAATNNNSTQCLAVATPTFPLPSGVFSYGVFSYGVQLVTYADFFPRIVTSFYWGLQQLSTLAGNQFPSPWVIEVIFIALVAFNGLILLALLIGNMSNFLMALSRRSFEYQIQRRDVNRWMQRRRIVKSLQRKVNDLQAQQWASTQGVADTEVLSLMPEELQRDLRRNLCFELLQASPLFNAMDAPVLDAFCERLNQQIYIGGTLLLREGYPVTRLFFVLTGELESFTESAGPLDPKSNLSKGAFLGEELLELFLNKFADSLTSKRQPEKDNPAVSALSLFGVEDTDVLPVAKRTVMCMGPVEGYSLEAADVAAVCRQHWQKLQKLQLIMRYEKPTRRKLEAALRIQRAWRRHQVNTMFSNSEGPGVPVFG